jgi:hypothetical protein
MLYIQKAPKGLIYRKEGDLFTFSAAVQKGSAAALQSIEGEVLFIYATEGKPEYTLYLSAGSDLIALVLSDTNTEALEVISAVGKAEEAGIDLFQPVTITAKPYGCKVTGYAKGKDTLITVEESALTPTAAFRREIIEAYAHQVNKSKYP